MRFRIVRDAIGYKVQQRKGLLWFDLKYRYDPHGTMIAYTFKSEDEARAWIRRNYGEQAGID